MPFKCKSNQIITERYDYILKVAENILLPVKAYDGEVIIVHGISIYNNTPRTCTYIYELIKRQGLICRVDFTANILSARVHLFSYELYLVNGDEAGISIRPNTAGDTIEMTIQYLRLRDDKYFL